MAKIEPPSRMALTPQHLDGSIVPGRLRFGLWEPPQIDMTTYSIYVVTEADQGRLDNVAHRTLGDSRLWWAIAYVNGIANPLAAMTVGQTLKIPQLEVVQAALLQQRVGA